MNIILEINQHYKFLYSKRTEKMVCLKKPVGMNSFIGFLFVLGVLISFPFNAVAASLHLDSNAIETSLPATATNPSGSTHTLELLLADTSSSLLQFSVTGFGTHFFGFDFFSPEGVLLSHTATVSDVTGADIGGPLILAGTGSGPVNGDTVWPISSTSPSPYTATLSVELSTLLQAGTTIEFALFADTLAPFEPIDTGVVAFVSEPSTFALFVLGLIGLFSPCKKMRRN